jgi:hypothetical protein
MHGTIMLQIPWASAASPSLPKPWRMARAAATPKTAAQTTVSVYADAKLAREKRRAEPGDSALEMSRMTAWYAVVAINAAGIIHSTGETPIASVAKIRAKVDIQRDVQMRGNSGGGNGSMTDTRREAWSGIDGFHRGDHKTCTW